LAILGAHDGGHLGRVQAAGEHPRPLRLELLVELVDIVEHLLHHFGARRLEIGGHVDGQQVLRHVTFSLFVEPAVTGSWYPLHECARPESTASTTFLTSVDTRSEEHTSELQSQSNLVCRLLLEKK